MGKLVRDLVPELMRSRGLEPATATVSGVELLEALLEKLLEEAQELRSASPLERLEEAADVYEVLLAIAEREGWTLADIQAAAERKRHARGGFANGVWLERW